MSEPAVCALVELAPASRGRVVEVPPGPLRVRLASLGVVAGATVELRQATPAVLVKIGATTLALEPEVGAQILVRRENGA